MEKRIDPISIKFRKLRERSGLSMDQLAKAMGYARASSIQRFENDYQKALLGLDVAQRLVTAIAGKGNPPIEASEIWEMAAPKGIDLSRTIKQAQPKLMINEGVRNLALSEMVISLHVRGLVKAGLFQDITMLGENDSFDQEEVHVIADPRFPVTSQYVLKVLGDSMNLEFPDGSYVHCIEFGATGRDLEHGMAIHVERYVGGGQLVENTLKEVKITNGVISLVPKSSNPIHKAIEMNGGEDTEIVVRGIVAGMYRPRRF